MRLLLKSFVVATITLALLAGCVKPVSTPQLPAGPSTPGPVKKYASEITVGTISSGASPQLLWGVGVQNGINFHSHFYTEHLILRNDKGEFVPRMAESVPTLQNGGAVWVGDGNARQLQVTYRLRPNLTWLDGTPITSSDILFAHELLTSPDFPTFDRSVINKVERVETPDNRTAVFVFKAGQIDVLYQTVGYLAPRHLLSGQSVKDLLASDHNRFPRHAGAYVLKDWQANVQFVYEANENHYLGIPRTKRLVITAFPDSNALFAAVKAGQVDIAGFGYIGLDLIPELAKVEATGAYSISMAPALSMEFLVPNHDHPFLKDVKVRRALQHAINRDELIQTVLSGAVQKSNTWLPPADPWMNQNVAAYDFDVRRAKALLAEAGFIPGPDGILARDGKRFAVDVWMASGNKPRERMVQAIQRYWREIGVEATLRIEPNASVYARNGQSVMVQRSFDFIVWQVTMAADFPNTMLVWHSSQIPTAANKYSGENFSGWRNFEADALIDQARTELDPAVRRPYLERHQAIWAEEMAALPIYNNAQIYAVKAGFEGFKPTNLVVNPYSWNAYEWALEVK